MCVWPWSHAKARALVGTCRVVFFSFFLLFAFCFLLFADHQSFFPLFPPFSPPSFFLATGTLKMYLRCTIFSLGGTPWRTSHSRRRTSPTPDATSDRCSGRPSSGRCCPTSSLLSRPTCAPGSRNWLTEGILDLGLILSISRGFSQIQCHPRTHRALCSSYSGNVHRKLVDVCDPTVVPIHA